MKKQEKIHLSVTQTVDISELIANKLEAEALEYIEQYKQRLKDKK